MLGRKASIAQTDNICQRCKQFEVDLTNTSDDLSAIDTELKASRQVISLLQRQLEILRREKSALEDLLLAKKDISSNSDHEISNNKIIIDQKDDGDVQDTSSINDSKDDDQKQLLQFIQNTVYTKEEELVKFRSKINDLSNEKEQIATKLSFIEDENEALRNENKILKESLALRDKTIVSLSNEVFEQGIKDNSQFSNDSPTTSKKDRSLTKLVDTLNAYKKTNELLSKNVIKLTEKTSTLEKREIEARSQSQELEAKCCQIQSKLLSLLKEIAQHSSVKGDGDQINNTDQLQDAITSDSVKLLIKRLLEDKSLEIPLSWKEGNNSGQMRSRLDGISDKLANSKYECDELGFYFVTIDESNNQVDVNAMGQISRSRQPSTSQAMIDDRPDQRNSRLTTDLDFVSCENIKRNILRQISIDATKNDETSWRLKWDYFIKDMDRIDLSKSKEFKNLLRSGVPQEYRCKVWKTLVNLRIQKERHSYGPDYYQSLLEPNKKPSSGIIKSLNPATKQIELDLLRTLPNNKHFETLDSSGTVRLRRVLTAYAEHNPKVAYCQGMNRLAAVALLVLPEEEAFWCLVTIVDNIMPKGYYNDLWLAQVDSSVVVNFLALKMPNLSHHFGRNNIELSLFAWFLTIFVDGTPPSLFLRLWDSFLYEGDKVLFRVSLALMKMFENQLMKLTNSVAVNNFLRSNVNAPMDVDYFFSIAFEWMNPLTSRSIRSKRQQNLQLIKSGLDSKDTFVYDNNSPGSSDKDDDRRRSRDSDHYYGESSIISI